MSGYSEMVGNRYRVPFVRLFPIWRFGPVYDIVDGVCIGEGWSPDRFEYRDFATRDEVEAYLVAARLPLEG